MSPARLERGLASALSAPRPRALVAAGLALLVLLGTLFRLDAEPISRKSEARAFEVARGMLGGEGWLVPRMDGEPRLQKPPLHYWAVAAAMAMAGESLAALRLPSALAALGLFLTVLRWGGRVGGFANGAVAAVCLLAMFQFWELARRGDAEMTLAFFSMQALYAFDRAYHERCRELLPWFFGAVWLAFLAKATAALLVIGLPVALRLGLDRSPSRVLRRDVLGWGLACVLACLAWYAAVLLWMPGAPAVLRESLLLPLGLAEATGSAAHVRPVWYYLPKLLAAAAPAVALAPLALWHVASHRGAPQHRRADFPALAFATLFVAFSLLPMKQRHYLLPLLPLLALAIAPALLAAYADHRSRVERTVAVLGFVLLAVAPVAVCLPVLHLVIAGEARWATALVGAAAVSACALGVASARAGCARVFGLSVAALTLVVLGVHRVSVDPLREGFRRNVAPGSIDFDAQRWSQLFDRHPRLRAVYLAEEWQAEADTSGPDAR